MRSQGVHKLTKFQICPCAVGWSSVIYLLALRQCFNRHMARSSSGLGRRPLKAEITSSNLVRATKDYTGLISPVFYYISIEC